MPGGQEGHSSGTETGRIYCIIVSTYVKAENSRNAADKYRSQGYQKNIITSTFSGGKKAQLVAVRIFATIMTPLHF